MEFATGPAPRSAREALEDGLRLWLSHWRSVLPVAILGWAPGQLGCMCALAVPLPPGQRLLLSLLSIALSLLGACFVSAAVVGLLVGEGPEHGAVGSWGAAVRIGLRRMAGVVRTQVLLLGLLGLVLLPAAVGLYLLVVRGLLPGEGLLGRTGPALALFFCTAPLASLLCLRCSLAPTAAAADEPGGLRALRRSAALSGDRMEDLLCFVLLVAAAMAPLLLLSLSSWLLLASRGLLLLGQGIGVGLSFLLTLQGQGAAVGLALLYADACAESGLPTRLLHLARRHQAT